MLLVEDYLKKEINRKTMDQADVFFKDFNHRLNQSEASSKQINASEQDNQRHIYTQDTSFSSQIAHIRKDFSEVSLQIKELTKAIFHLGSLLKEKVHKAEVEKLKERIDSLKTEDFIRHNELEKTFYSYAKK